jgi:hypothetical protein
MTVEVEGARAKKAVYYCPLYSAAFRVLYQCIEEKCAWWGGELRGCAVQALFDLTTVAEVMESRGEAVR